MSEAELARLLAAIPEPSWSLFFDVPRVVWAPDWGGDRASLGATSTWASASCTSAAASTPVAWVRRSLRFGKRRLRLTPDLARALWRLRADHESSRR